MKTEKQVLKRLDALLETLTEPQKQRLALRLPKQAEKERPGAEPPEGHWGTFTPGWYNVKNIIREEVIKIIAE